MAKDFRCGLDVVPSSLATMNLATLATTNHELFGDHERGDLATLATTNYELFGDHEFLLHWEFEGW